MAAINTIRNNGWLLIILLGLALAGFILMDLVTNTQNYSSADMNTYGKVNGTEIDRGAFDRYRDVIWAGAQGDPNEVNASVWNYFVEKALVEEVAEEAGLGVPKAELDDLQYGTNLSPIMQQRYSDPSTRQVNRELLTNVKTQIENGQFEDPRNRMYWAEQQKEIIKERLQSKVSNIMAKSIYTPSWMAKQVFEEGNQRLDVAYVRVPFDKVPADAVTLTDADYSSYLAKNEKRYWQDEEQRVIDYVVFDVIPSAADSATSLKKANTYANGFAAAENDSAFVVSNGGQYDVSYKLKADYPAIISERLFSEPVGSVVGPYLDGDMYTVAKILDRKTIADSVRARHILIKPENEGGVAQAEAKVDSLIQVLKSGAASFKDLAAKFGTDGTATKGGDLGYFTPRMMVKEFSDIAFYTGKQGVPTKVATQFGWHVIEVTGKKFINNNSGAKVAFLSDRIMPSKQTQTDFNNIAIDLMNKAGSLEELTSLAAEQNKAVVQSPALKASDFSIQGLGKGQDAKDIVLWAYKKGTKVGAVNKNVFKIGDDGGGYFDAKYVIAGLSKIIEKGAPKVEDVKSSIEAAVLNSKKAAYLQNEIGSGATLSAVASKYGVSIDTAKAATLQNINLQNGGREPLVVGTAFGTGAGTTSAPIAGNNGVYLVAPAAGGTMPPAPEDLTMFRRQAASQLQSQVKSRFLQTIMKGADLVDRRNAGM